MEVLIRYEKPKKSIIKEEWQTEDNDLSFIANTKSKFKIVSQEEDIDSYEDLAKEIKANHALPKSLSVLPCDMYNRWSTIQVFRYPVFMKSYRPHYRNMPTNEQAKATKQAKEFCRHYGTLILNKGGIAIDYAVSSKRIAVDDDFVISYKEGHCVMEYNPKRAAKIRRTPIGTLDPFHRRGFFRTIELNRLLWLFQRGIEYHPKFKGLVCYIRWHGCHKPKEENISKMIPKACAAYTHIHQGPKYRSDADFLDILEKAKVALKYAKKNAVPMPPWRKNLYAFLKREIRIAVMSGKMV